ncbi:MAG TPA: asparagine synthase (glutamine-hydrolyzing) [Stellaceae bacterium]|nr:asparagine synthase (glutamine-hydrolyzing) [Stellaceae bacterium]
MCGIAGFYGRFDRALLTRMTDALAHRGPDDAGHELLPGRFDGMAVGLGHRRLSIIDLAGGHQPMWDHDGKTAIVFNGEIYNYRELQAELRKAGARLRTNSDTEVILAGWRLWGEEVVSRLEGMFAFAIWDDAGREWFLARDRFGIKPLFYCQPDAGGFAFASEIKPLLPLIGGARVNQAALYDYLLHGWVATEETAFAGIRQLRPGHLLRLAENANAPSLRRYWRLERASAQRSEDEWREAITEALDRAVSSHLVADVPVGITLSGGLDSSALLASMVRAKDAREIAAFSLGYGLADDELPWARKAAGHCGVRLVERIVPPETFAENFARCIWHLEEPIAHPVMQTTFQLGRMLHDQVKVVLIGEGADELFAGYPEFRVVTGPFGWAPRRLQQRSFLAVCCLMPTAGQLRRLLRRENLDEEALDRREQCFRPYFANGSIADGALQFELEKELVYNQLARVDKLMMAHSIEARVPFLDRAFSELVHAAPFGLKLRDGVHKHLLRAAAAPRLPAGIVRRPKTGKGGTQALLPTVTGMLHGSLSHLLTRDAIGSRGWFDPDAVARYLGAARRADIRLNPIASRRRAKFALALAVLEQWARLFFDGEKA